MMESRRAEAGAMANGTRTTADVVIVGGGVLGCATAYYLAEQGVRVALIEQQRIGGPPSASAASAAILEALAGSPQPLALQAQLARRLLAELAPQLRDLTGIDIELQQLGSLHLAFSEREALALRQHLAPRFAALDEPVQWLDAADARQLEPALAETIRGALYVPHTCGLYAPKYVRALAAAAAARGAAICQGMPVTGFEVQGERAR
jgi:glycine oxidase